MAPEGIDVVKKSKSLKRLFQKQAKDQKEKPAKGSFKRNKGKSLKGFLSTSLRAGTDPARFLKKGTAALGNCKGNEFRDFPRKSRTCRVTFGKS